MQPVRAKFFSSLDRIKPERSNQQRSQRSTASRLKEKETTKDTRYRSTNKLVTEYASNSKSFFHKRKKSRSKASSQRPLVDVYANARAMGSNPGEESTLMQS